MKGFLEKLFSRFTRIFKSEEGFSLIEIMIVLVIIAIIGAIAIPQIMKIPDQARVTAAKTQASKQAFETTMSH